MPIKDQVKKAIFAVSCLFVVLLSLAMNTTIPFVTLPTLGQAVWTIGFAQSYANEGLFSVFSHNFGYPYPASIAFGLSGSLLTSFFIRLAMSGDNAYTLMYTSYLLLALYGAYQLSSCFNSNNFVNLLFALLWMCFPVIRMHLGYGMLAIGFALLPLYFYSYYNFCSKRDTAFREKIRELVFFGSVAILSVFTDGYTFVMFAVSVGVLMVGMLCPHRTDLKRLLLHLILPTALIFCLAYLLYVSFIRFQSFPKAPITFFTSWGADLVMLLSPTKGIYYFFDLLDLSVARGGKLYFGDSSVWKNTFILPIFLMSMIAFAMTMKLKIEKTLIFVGLAIALIGMYMSLGPYLKVGFKKRDLPQEAMRISPVMLSETQKMLFPTGSMVVTKNLPGLNSMRASYRWIGLGFLGCWLLTIVSFQHVKKRHLFIILTLLLILTYLPNLQKQISHGCRKKKEYNLMDEQYIKPLSKLLLTGETVAFVPWGNDFLVNHVAANLNINAYNIGGDKNLHIASQHWPKNLIEMGKDKEINIYIKNIYDMFKDGQSDKIILTKIDLLHTAHQWPPVKHRYIKIVPKIIDTIKQDNVLTIYENDYYAVLHLDSNGKNLETLLEKRNLLSNHYRTKKSILADNFTQVGVVQDNVLITTGKKGFLLFGPYIEFVKGTYQILLYGELESGSLIVDIVSERGKKVHFKKRISSSKNETLLEGRFYLTKTVEDLEVRVFVEEDTKSSIRSYELTQCAMMESSLNTPAQIVEVKPIICYFDVK